VVVRRASVYCVALKRGAVEYYVKEVVTLDRVTVQLEKLKYIAELTQRTLEPAHSGTALQHLVH
jgi:hypothetical protein